MSTSKQEIRQWLESGRSESATHMLVLAGTGNMPYYPVYVEPGQDVLTVFAGFMHKTGQRVVEVYALHLDWEEQLNRLKSMRFETESI